jgi:hypothetical protein
VRLEKLGELKKSTSSGTQTDGLPVCSIVPQQITLPRNSYVKLKSYTLLNFFVILIGSSMRDAKHSPAASAEVKKMWIYASTAPYAFMA